MAKKRRKPNQALVVLECGDYDPNRHLYDQRVLYMCVVDCDADGRIGRLPECSLYGLRLLAWAVIKKKSLVNRFVEESARGHIRGNWFRASYTSIEPVADFMNGDVVFAEGSRLAYLKDALDCRASFARKLARACEASTAGEL